MLIRKFMGTFIAGLIGLHFSVIFKLFFKG